MASLATLEKLGVPPAAVRKTCALYAVDVSDVLATPRHAQAHDVARARVLVWRELEGAGVTLTRVARLWGTSRATVDKALQRRAKRAA
jgi:hypothetical protein